MKTNLQYLGECLDKIKSTFTTNPTVRELVEESVEWHAAAAKETEGLKDLLLKREQRFEKVKDERDKAIESIAELQSEFEAFKQSQSSVWYFEHAIDCGHGKVRYSTDNLQVQQMMESFARFVKALGPLAMERTLDMALKVPAE